MAKLPEVTIEKATRKLSSCIDPNRLLSKITRKPIEEMGYWNGKTTEQLSVESYPKFLTDLARGQFPRIEKSLKKRGVHIPKDWQVQHMLTCLAVGGAKILDSLAEQITPVDKDNHPIDFSINQPSVALIIDPYYQKRLGYDIAVHFRVVIAEQEFIGRINTPEYPKWLLEKDIKPGLETCVGVPVVSTRFGNREKTLSVNSFIKTDGKTTYATALYDQLIDFATVTIKASQRSRLSRLLKKS